MSLKIDLHTHTTASDGVLSPTELVQRAAQAGIGILAITDHDTVDALPEAVQTAAPLGLRVVPGVEFGTDVGGNEVHMLAYFFDPAYPPLVRVLSELREGRVSRGERILAKLAALGAPISWERVQEIATGPSVGRPHIAQALIEAGHATSIDDAFNKYLGHGRPAYVERTQLTPVDCIALAHEAGSVAVLAHPTWIDDPEALLPSLVDAGLDGIETYYGTYPPETVAWLEGLARRYNLVPTGGTDYHGSGGPTKAELGSVSVPVECFDALEKRARGAR